MELPSNAEYNSNQKGSKKKTVFEVKVNDKTLRFFTKEEFKPDEKRTIFGYSGEKTHGTSIIGKTEVSTHQSTYEKNVTNTPHQNILPSTNPSVVLESVAKEVSDHILPEEYNGVDLYLFTKMDELNSLFIPTPIEVDGKVVQQKDIVDLLAKIAVMVVGLIKEKGPRIDVTKISDYEGKVLFNDKLQFFVVFNGKVLRYDVDGFGKVLDEKTLGKLSGSSFMLNQEVLQKFLDEVGKGIDPKAIFPPELLNYKPEVVPDGENGRKEENG